MTELVCSMKLGPRDALLGRILDAADRNKRSSQPIGSLCCGRRLHFRKLPLSTDQFKLKVTSRS